LGDFFEKLRPYHLGDISQKKMRPRQKNIAQSGHTVLIDEVVPPAPKREIFAHLKMR
jgi:hypothetical protein